VRGENDLSRARARSQSAARADSDVAEARTSGRPSGATTWLRPVNGTVAFTGRSQIVAPNGRPLVRAPKSGDLARAADCDLDEARDKTLTAITHLFRNRRPEHYRALVAPARRRRGPAARGAAR